MHESDICDQISDSVSTDLSVRPSTIKPRFAIIFLFLAMNIHLQPILTHLKQELTDLYGDRLQHLPLFGSQARGDAEPGSDIDVLVVLKPPVNPGEEIKRTGKAIADLSLDYDARKLETMIYFI